MHKHGVVVGRFQPFHNGHLTYVQKALERCEHLYIGITTPGNEPTIYEPSDPDRLGTINNPFSYEDRVGMMQAALDDLEVDPGRTSFVPFNPEKIDDWYANVPKDAVYFLLLLSPDEEKKVAEMQAHGLQVEVLDRRYDRVEAAGDIRSKMSTGESWEHLVPKAVAKYIRSLELDGSAIRRRCQFG